MLRILFPLLALIFAGTAQAEWREARSKHFFVYSAGSEKSLRKATEDLEKYFFMLRFVTQVPDRPTPIPIKIYLMRNTAAVAETMGGGAGGVAGYYSASPRGPIAVGIRTDTGGEYGLSAQEVLFHELAHHFMFQYFPAAYPPWYSEGFADYYGSARILDKDVIEVGRPVDNRYLSFRGNNWLPVGRLLTAKSYADVSGRIDLLYSQGWLLTHYLSMQKKRAGQLKQYLAAINAGVSYAEARDRAFGKDAKALNGELHSYAGSSRLMALSLPFKPIDVGDIATRALTSTEEALINYDIQLGRGIRRSEARAFGQAVENASKRFPDEPHALRLRVEAHRAAGDHAAAKTALDRWLALRPNDALALMHRGELAIDSLANAKSTDAAAWQAARAYLLAANRNAPKTPQILVAYYDSFLRRGELPPSGAQNGIMMAFDMVPQDDNLRQMVAADFEARGMIDEAIAVITPSAVQLHAGGDPDKMKRDAERREKYREVGDRRTETAQEMLTRLQAAKAKGATIAAAD